MILTDKKVNFGVIGLGNRGHGMMKSIQKLGDTAIVAVSDKYPDRIERAQNTMLERQGFAPAGFADYHELLTFKGLDAVYIAADWEMHVEMAIAAMEAGIPTALEVGGAYSVADCMKLVEVWEKTNTPFMFMENCCYDRGELLAASMARAGLFGRIVHCSGAYAHDLRDEVSGGNINRHYRLRNYICRNCENYPTHDLGPIAKILDLNRGNRLVSLTSVASLSAGLEEYIEKNKLWEKDPTLKGQKFNQGDIVNTILTCENGETILLTLDTTLPRFYTRAFTVRGTKGFYEQNTNTVFIDGVHSESEWTPWKNYATYSNNASEYEEKYLPSLWRDITPEQRAAGHGGMDYFELRAFTDAVRSGDEMPIDVYDAALWMSITPISEESIRNGGTRVEVPDFTHGLYKTRAPKDVVKI